MIPRLYPAEEETFASFGDSLNDCITCEVSEERNGEYVLYMEYPQGGIHGKEIEIDKIILAKPSDGAEEPEPFRITDISASINGTYVINAEHISYQLNHIIVGQITKTTRYAERAMTQVVRDKLLSASCPFTFISDIGEESSPVKTVGPSKAMSMREYLGGTEGSVLDTYGGEFLWNRWNVSLLASRGNNNGVKITYGKNITGLNYEIDLSSVYTGVVAFFMNETDYVESVLQTIQNSYAFERSIVVDASSEFQSVPTVEQLNTWAANYLAANSAGARMTVTVNFIPLWQSIEYKDFYDLEHVSLCDTVEVIYPPLNLDLSAKVVRTVYDVLRERYKEITIGTPGASLDGTIVKLLKKTK